MKAGDVFHCGITVILRDAIPLRWAEEQTTKSKSKTRNSFEQAEEIFLHPYYLDRRSDLPEQYRAIGWVGERLYTLIFEVREDKEGEYYHFVTLWRATSEEQRLYEEHS